nr:unnamed protein product [Callosobruchus analis]
MSGQWIGRRGPIEFPPRSPDLTPLDFFLWGTVKDEVYKQEARRTGFRLWSQGSWTFMNPGKGHSRILAELHEDSPIFVGAERYRFSYASLQSQIYGGVSIKGRVGVQGKTAHRRRRTVFLLL